MKESKINFQNCDLDKLMRSNSNLRKSFTYNQCINNSNNNLQDSNLQNCNLNDLSISIINVGGNKNKQNCKPILEENKFSKNNKNPHTFYKRFTYQFQVQVNGLELPKLETKDFASGDQNFSSVIFSDNDNKLLTEMLLDQDEENSSLLSDIEEHVTHRKNPADYQLKGKGIIFTHDIEKKDDSVDENSNILTISNNKYILTNYNTEEERVIKEMESLKIKYEEKSKRYQNVIKRLKEVINKNTPELNVDDSSRS